MLTENHLQDIDMKSGDIILILPSIALSLLQLEPLAGQRAKIVQVHSTEHKVKGCWVELNEPFLEEREWYIPYSSIGI